MKRFFRKYEKEIDKEAYVFYTLKTIRESKRDPFFAEIEKKCIEALKNSNYIHFEINPNNTWQGDEIMMVTAQDLTGTQTSKKRSENAERIEQISEKIEWEDLFGLNSIEEALSIAGYVKNQDLKRYIAMLFVIDALAKVTPLSLERKNELLRSPEEVEELGKYYNKDISAIPDKTEFRGRVSKYVKKYPDAFDLDKIFLIAAFRVNSYLERANLPETENAELAQVLTILKESIRDHKAIVSGIDASRDGGTGKSYSYNAIVAACKRITPNGKYVSTTQEELIRKNLEEDPNSILEIDPDIFSIIKLPVTKLMEISQNEGVFSYLVQNKLLTKNKIDRIIEQYTICESDIINLINGDNLSKEQIKKYIKKVGHISSKLFLTLDQKDFFTAGEKLECYINGKLEIDALSNMADDKKDEIAQLLSPEELIALYKDETKSEEYSRYAAIFRNFILAEKDKQKKKDIESKMIEALADTLSEEDLINLYQEHLISLSTVEDWSGGKHITVYMMKNAMLRPSDVKEICLGQNYDSVIEIMKDPEISRKNKLAIFYTTFADEDDSLTAEQRDFRELAKKECLRCMNFSDKQEKRSSNGNESPRTNNSNEGDVEKKRKEFVSDPLDRWTLFKLLDPEYSYEMLDQGMMIFKCPNLKNGLVFLEKMFKKDEPDYGRATKVLSMSIEDFEKIKDDLIVDGDIPPYKVDSHPALQENVDSIWHSTAWGQRIADLCDYKIDKRRSKENIEAIDRTIERIKKSRKLRK